MKLKPGVTGRSSIGTEDTAMGADMSEAAQQSKRISEPVIVGLITLVSVIAVLALLWMSDTPKGWIPRRVAEGIVIASWFAMYKLPADNMRLGAVLIGVGTGVLVYVR
jgi:hypothetical protein